MSPVMAGFKGKYLYSVDEKGRISIPAKLRKNLSEAANNSFVVMRGFEGCLFLYPFDIWQVKEREMHERLDPYNPEDRSFLRSLSEWVNDLQLDRQQRVMIPPEHLHFAAIRETVVLLGTLDKIELWNPERYQAYMAEVQPHYEAIAAKVMGKR